MIAAFLLPFPLRGYRAPYLWVYYRLLSSFDERVLFITSEDYLCDPDTWRDQNRWELHTCNTQRLGYEVPTREQMDAHDYRFVSSGVLDALLLACGGNPLLAFKRMLSERVPCLDVAFDLIMSNLQARDIEVVLTWCNCPSLSAAAGKVGIRVLHLEMGPLRWPHYRPTAYVDFSGANGHSEAEQRYCVSGFNGAGLSTEMQHDFFFVDELTATPGALASLGVALQVEDDSNLLAFGNGFDNQGLLAYALFYHADDDVLVRAHPGSLFDLKPGRFAVDDSTSSLAFIQRCNKLLTINSSVGLEALLMGKPVEVLGDCPHRFITRTDDAYERSARLTFYLFAYLVPLQLVYELAYLRFRLSGPSEAEIVARHLDAYLGHADWRRMLRGGACGSIEAVLGTAFQQLD